MEAIWEHCFTDCLRVDTSTTRVFLTEAHNVHKETREKTVETMFELFDVEATYLHVQPVLALFAAGLTSGCVIDSGEYSTTVYPVADGYHLVNASVKLPYGGSQITEILTHLLLDTGYGPRFGEQPALHQTVTTKKLEIVRDMKEKFAYVRADPNSSTAARMTYNLPDGKSVLLESELYKCTEQFFNPQQFNHMFSESEDTPIQEAIFKAINACSMDVRKTLFSNIVLAGGNTMFKGFQKRLANELKQIVPQGMASSVRITGSNDRSKAIWNGGAILAAMSTFEDRWIMGADYDEIGPNIVHDKCAVYL
jgi:actin-related protein